MTSYQNVSAEDPCAQGCVPWTDCEEKRGKDGVSTYRRCMRMGPSGKPCGKFVSRSPEGCTHPVNNIKEGTSAKGPYRFCGDCKTSFLPPQGQGGQPKRAYTEISASGPAPPREDKYDVLFHRVSVLEAELARINLILGQLTKGQ